MFGLFLLDYYTCTEAQIPLGRLGQPADHAGATVFLASDMASYVGRIYNN